MSTTLPDSPVPGSPGAGLSLVLSPSSLSRFTECEMKYVLDQASREVQTGGLVPEKGIGLRRGTAIHTLLEARWLGKDWREAIPTAALDASPNWSPEWDYPQPVKDAIRLAERHELAYPVLPQMIASEFQFKVKHPYVKGLEIQGFMDGIVLADDGLWILENKSMSRWDRLDWLEWDPQPATYMFAATQMGYSNIKGVLFDAIYTVEWKEEREPEASFRRLWLPFDQGKVDEVLAEYAKVATRIQYLEECTRLELSLLYGPVRNSGKACKYCDFVRECHGSYMAQ